MIKKICFGLSLIMIIVVIIWIAQYEKVLQAERLEKEKIFSEMCKVQNGILLTTKTDHQCVSEIILSMKRE